MKKCKSCGIEKPFTEFFKHSQNSKKKRLDVYRANCKPCTSKIVKSKFESLSEEEKNKVRFSKRKWHHLNPDKSKERSRAEWLKTYGLTPDMYEEMYNSQNRVCWICKNPETIKHQRLAVDHCHTTGKVRGLLCSKCNRGLGLFKDSIKLLEVAIEYLKKE